MKTLTLVLLLTISLLSGCSGSGSGGEEEGPSSDNGIRVFHGALDFAPVDIFADPATLISRTRFFATPEYRRLPGSLTAIQITRATRPELVLGNLPFNFDAKGKYSLVVSGRTVDEALRFKLLSDQPEQLDRSASYLRLINALDGALELSVNFDTSSLKAQYSDASPYLALTPGIRSISVKRSADQLTVFNSTSELEAGNSYTVFVGGEMGYFVSGLFVKD